MRLSSQTEEEYRLTFKRLISLHFPKAGGTSLLKQFMALLPTQEELDYDHEPLSEAGREVSTFPKGKRVVHGHFRPQRYAHEEAFRVTFLRDPVENLISIYYFWLTLESDHPAHTKFINVRPDIFSFAPYPMFTTLMSQTYFGGFEMERFDFIGYHDTRESDLPLLGRLLGLPLRGDVHENKTPSASERDALQANTSAMRRLRDLLSARLSAFQAARHRVWQSRFNNAVVICTVSPSCREMNKFGGH
jgi:hypothetical protein